MIIEDHKFPDFCPLCGTDMMIVPQVGPFDTSVGAVCRSGNQKTGCKGVEFWKKWGNQIPQKNHFLIGCWSVFDGPVDSVVEMTLEDFERRVKLRSFV